MNDNSLELLNTKESSSSISIEDNDNKTENSFLRVCKKCYLFCEAYGAVVAYYGAVLGAITAAIWAPIANDFEGGCKYPYLSEVARDGFGRFLFLCGANIGGIAWIIFSFNYYSVFKQVSNSVLQFITLLFNIISACGMICTAFFDMGHYPMTHMVSVALFSVPLNLLMINNFVDMIIYAKQTNCWYTVIKSLAFIWSLGGILAFTLLGRINSCKSITLTIEQCLHETAEEVCMHYLSNELDGYTRIRYYPHCQTMHFWRGFIEYIALLCSTQLLLFLFYDRNTMQGIVMEKINMIPVNPFILKEMKEQKEVAESCKEEEKLIV